MRLPVTKRIETLGQESLSIFLLDIWDIYTSKTLNDLSDHRDKILLEHRNNLWEHQYNYLEY